MHQVAAAVLALFAGFQDKELETRVDQVIALMRMNLEERAKGYKILTDLRQTRPPVVPILRDRLAAEKDPRIRMRLLSALGAYMADRYWESKLDTMNFQTIAVNGGRLYYQKKDGTAAALVVKTGDEDWVGPKMPAWTSPPRLSARHIWVEQPGLQNQSTLCQVPLDDPKEASILKFAVDPGKFCVDGTYVGMRNLTRFRVQHVDSPKKGWEGRCPDRFKATLGANMAVISDGEGLLCGYNVKTSKQEWATFFDWSMNVFEVRSDLLIVRSYRPRLRAIEAATGKVVWSEDHAKDSPEAEAPLVFTDQYIIARGTPAVCRDLKTGRKVWSTRLPALGATATLPHAIIGNVLVWVEEKKFNSFDISTGQELQKQDIVGSASPVTTILAASEGMFVAIQQDGTVSSWRLAFPSK